MNAESFAEWLRRQGRQVVRTASSYWYEAGPRVFQAFPYHWLIRPSEQELRELMVSRSILALRYSAPVHASDGMISYHVVLNGPYNLAMLRAQARNGVRRGLSHFQVEPIGFERLAAESWILQQDTLARQGRVKSMSCSEWQTLSRAAEGLPGFEAWGATFEGELAASLLTARVDDTCYVPYAQSHSKFLRLHVNNALFYTVSCELLARRGVTGIFFGLHSLDAPESIDEFKFRMSFAARPVRQRVVFHPWLEPFANASLQRVLARLLIRFPGNPVLSKAEGMVRFRLQGKRPLETQEWPACLAEQRALLQGMPAAELMPETDVKRPGSTSLGARGGAQHEAA
jgi:hypothetical protein